MTNDILGCQILNVAGSMDDYPFAITSDAAVKAEYSVEGIILNQSIQAVFLVLNTYLVLHLVTISLSTQW